MGNVTPGFSHLRGRALAALRSPADVGGRTDPQFALVLAIAATLPFEFTKQWFPVEWLEVARLLIGAGIAGLAIRMLQRRAAPIDGRLAGAVAFVVAVGCLSFALTHWPTGAKDAASLVIYALFAAVVSQSVRTPRRVAAVVTVLCASGTLVGAIAISQELFDYYIWRGDGLDVLSRRNATFNDPNITARFLLISVAGVLGLAARARRSNLGLGLLVGAVMSIHALGLLVTQSRSGWALAALLVLGWLPMAWTRKPLATALAFFSGIMIISLVTVPFARARLGIDVPMASQAAPQLVRPEDGAVLIGSSHTLEWMPPALPQRSRLEIRNLASGELVEPAREIEGAVSSDLIGASLDTFERIDGRSVRSAGQIELVPAERPGLTSGLGIRIARLEPGRSALVTGPDVRHAYDGVSDAAPFRLWVRASTLENLESVGIIFRFQGLESNHAVYDVTPREMGTWEEILVRKGNPSALRGTIDWGRVRRIDIQVQAATSGPYGGEISVADLRAGSILTAGEAYEWRVQTDSGQGYGPALVATFEVDVAPTVENVRVANEPGGGAASVPSAIAWDFSGNQTAYRVLISGDTEFDSGLLTGTETRFEIPAGVLSAGGHYAIEVVAIDEAGLLAASEPLILEVPKPDSARATYAVWQPASLGIIPHPGRPQPDHVDPGGATVVAPWVDRIRASLIAAGLAMFRDHPTLGVGIGGFQPMLLGPYREYMLPEYRAQPTTLPHTHLVQVAAETGLVGLVGYVALLGFTIRNLVLRYRAAAPRHRPLIVLLTTAIGIIYLSSQFEGRFYQEPYLWLLLGMAAGATGSVTPQPTRPRTTLPASGLFGTLLGASQAILAATRTRRCRSCSSLLPRRYAYCPGCDRPLSGWIKLGRRGCWARPSSPRSARSPR